MIRVTVLTIAASGTAGLPGLPSAAGSPEGLRYSVPTRRRGRGARAARSSRQDLLDLPEVIEVVPGEHPDDSFDRLRSALGMDAVVLPLRRVERRQQREVGLAHDAELLDRLPRIAPVVVAARDPGVLIVGADRRARRSENEAQTKRADDLAVGKVGNDLAHRPGVGRGTSTQAFRRDVRGQTLERPWRRRQHGERILAVNGA